MGFGSKLKKAVKKVGKVLEKTTPVGLINKGLKSGRIAEIAGKAAFGVAGKAASKLTGKKGGRGIKQSADSSLNRLSKAEIKDAMGGAYTRRYLDKRTPGMDLADKYFGKK